MIAEVRERDPANRRDPDKARSALYPEFAGLMADIKRLKRLQRLTLWSFVPLWIGTFGLMIAVVLKG